jgi:DNA-directed RNA polymerase alpha subunit
VKEVLSKFHIKIDPSTPVDELYFTVRIWNCLHNAGIENIGQLISLTEKDVLKIKNFGRKSLEELKGELGEYNLFLSKERCPVCGKEIDESPSCG